MATACDAKAGRCRVQPGPACSVVYALQARCCIGLTTASQHIADAPLAQSAERLHGKEKVYGSIP
jgi:hypothetical protein